MTEILANNLSAGGATTFPRLLVISPTRIGTTTATGALMRALLIGWPRDRLAQIHSDHYREFEHDVCNNFFLATTDQPPLLHRVRKKLGLATVNGRPPRRFQSRAIDRYVDEFAPDVIYCRPVELPPEFLPLPERLKRRTGASLVMHIMDDWPARQRMLAERAAAHQRQALLQNADWADHQLRHSFKCADVNLAICEKMASAFGERYDVTFRWFKNGVDLEHWQQPKQNFSWQTQRPFQVLYSGSLAEDMQLHSVVEVAESIGRLRQKGIPIELVVQTNETWLRGYNKRLADRDGVSLRLQVPWDEYPGTLASADLLLFAMNYDDLSLAYTRYSFANKMPEYLASGTPIFAYGPMESASIEFLVKHELAAAVTEPEPAAIDQALLQLIENEDRRRTLGTRARLTAVECFRLDRIRSEFQQLLINVASGIEAAV